MKKGFENVVAWQYDGCTAVGVLYDYEYVSVAVNYRMDSNVKEGDLWYMDSIYTDRGCNIRLATDGEIRTLINALDNWKESYKYDAKTRKIRIYSVYPTLWTRMKKWFFGLFKK